MAEKYYFIINPISGHANNAKYAEDVIALMKARAKESGKDIEIHEHVLSARGEAEHYTSELSGEIGADGVVVSVGGDGTFNEIASSLTGKDTPIAVIPRGSGNGLARMLSLPHTKDDTVEYLLTGRRMKIDSGRFGERQYFCTAGFGFEACIAFLFDKTGNVHRGKQEYVKHIMKEIFTYNPIYVNMEVDGEVVKGEYMSVCLANANQYGNNAIISPDADLEDGHLRLVMIKPFPIAMAGTMALALMGGYIDKVPMYVERRVVDRVKVTEVSDARFHCDGEPLRMELPLEVSVNPMSLNMIVPQDYKPVSPRAFDKEIEDINRHIAAANEMLTNNVVEQMKKAADLRKELRTNAEKLISKYFSKR